jgi:PAS domain S-box-containing protein
MGKSSAWAQPEGVSGVTGQTIRVLHVEDQYDFADLVADMLERQSDRFTVETASDASEGLARLEAAEYDVVVSDYDMPGRNGIEFLEAVREKYPDLPFILYTGKGSEEVASDAISAGVTDYLQKSPGNEQYELLANRIENAVSKYRAEQRADQVKRRMEELAETTHDVLYLFSRDWDELLFVNSAYEEIWGQSIDKLAANPRDFLSGVHPDDRARVIVGMTRATRGESVDVEFRVNPTEDYGRWVEAQAEPIFDATGDVVRVGGFVRDITDRKEHEETLERTTDLLEQAQEMAGVTGWELDVSSYDPEMIVTDEFYRLHEFPEDTELSLDRIVDRYHPEDRDYIRSELQTAIEAGDSFDMEVRLGNEDGDVRWVRILCNPVTETGNVVKLRGSLQDITDRKRRETELEQTRERMEFALEVTDAVVWDFDIVTDELTSYPSSDQLLGNVTRTFDAFLEQVHPEDRERVRDALEDGYETGEYTAEFRVTRNGDDRWIRGEGRIEHNDDGEPTRGIGVARDVTERKERERRLERKNERLAEFASVVSHDLQNPLQVAETRLGMAQQECDSEHLEAVVRSHDRMKDLIEDLLTLAKEGAVVEETEPVDLSATAERAVRNVTTDDVSLVTDTDCRIRADPDRLQQLLENLIHNAVEHCDDGVTVTVGDFEDGLYVADDGPGIPPAEREQVLERGYSTSETGTGFGLSIVQEIAHAHDWEVSIDESEDGGTRIEITGVTEPDTLET